jgi:ATP-dependent DNA ligase
LTVDFVFKTLEAIAKTSGKDVSYDVVSSRIDTNTFKFIQSQARKVGLIQKILISCQGSETRFIIRSLEGKLRIGLAEKTLVTALAHAIVLKDVGKKKAQQAELAEKLARGNEIVKQVYR